MIIQIIGLPGSGKTERAMLLKTYLKAVHLNADDVRADLCKDLDFSPASRVEQARRMGALARLLVKQDCIVIADFVCPTEETRAAFGKPDILVWVDRIKESRFEDTNKLWQDPTEYDLRITNWEVTKSALEILNCVNQWYLKTLIK